MTLSVLCWCAGAFALGSIPFGYLVGRWYGIDVRRAGSGNIGATNVARLLGRRWAVGVFLADMLKGFAPTFVASRFFPGVGPLPADSAAASTAVLAVGFAAILGHNHSIFLGFKGGKGVATGLGVCLGVYPDLTFPALGCLVLWGLIVGVTRYVSLASMVAAATLPPAVLLGGWVRGRSLSGLSTVVIASVLMAGMICLRHRRNIGRLRTGKEWRLGAAGAASPPPDTGNGV